MKTSILHLPTKKHQELEVVISKIVEIARPEMVILFGSYARGDWTEDSYVENGITYEYMSDYDLLVVVEKEKNIPAGIGKNIRKRVKKSEAVNTRLGLIFHGIDYLNQELEGGNYFFSDISKEGIILYESGNYKLAKAKPLSPKGRRIKAQKYFDHWFESAGNFYKLYQLAVKNGIQKEAIFQLHQSTERFYIATLLVFTDYKPKTHHLEELDRKVARLDADFKTVFPRKTEEDERLFTLINKAYIDSRYKMGYNVELSDLEYLAKRVKKLRDLTERICREKIEGFLSLD